MQATDIAQLSPQERLDLISALWDSLTAEDLRLTPAQEAELGRRQATFETDRSNAVEWAIVEAEFDRSGR